MEVKGSEKNLKIEVSLRNMYEYRIARDRLSSLTKIVNECENNPESKKEQETERRFYPDEIGKSMKKHILNGVNQHR